MSSLPFQEIAWDSMQLHEPPNPNHVDLDSDMEEDGLQLYARTIMVQSVHGKGENDDQFIMVGRSCMIKI